MILVVGEHPRDLKIPFLYEVHVFSRVALPVKHLVLDRRQRDKLRAKLDNGVLGKLLEIGQRLEKLDTFILDSECDCSESTVEVVLGEYSEVAIMQASNGGHSWLVLNEGNLSEEITSVKSCELVVLVGYRFLRVWLH